MLDHEGIRKWKIRRLDASGVHEEIDTVVVEEPLEMRVVYGTADARQEIPLSITMRTPGDDLHLVAGFFITEGIVQSMRDIKSLRQVSENVVVAELEPEFVFIPEKLTRHFYTSSSCGVCGKASIDMVRQVSAYRLTPGYPQISSEIMLRMGKMLSEGQPLFAATGGIHATALFSTQGELLCTKEDIGRHNAMDKLIGWAAMRNLLPLSHNVVVVSGRGGFELVQKAIAGGLPVFAAVGAPSSLALELAQENDMTLAGFLRSDRMNVYTGAERMG